MALAERSATAIWTGDLMSGSGELDFKTGAVPNLPVSWAARTEAPGGKTSPEELLAAAQSACFAMAFSAGLARGGNPPEKLEVTTTCTLDRVDNRPTITSMHIHVKGTVPGIDAEAFDAAAQDAGKGCPVARAFHGNMEQSVTSELA